MLDVFLIGTGGMMPLPFRFLTSLVLRLNGSTMMIDCGEGTQVALRKKGLSANPIDLICFTHYHGDHISGLPGLLLTMGNSERKEPLTLIGPKGLERVAGALRVVAPELPFPIVYREFTGQEADFSIAGYEIHAFRVNHNVPCFGYCVEVPRLGLFDPERARKNDVPLKYWNRLQHGESIEDGDRIFTPDLVMGPQRKGLKLVYSTDTRPTDSIRKYAKDTDLLILEGMYGDKTKLPSAREKKHMMMQEACEIAAGSGTKELWLTHFSPALTHPSDYAEELKAIFPNTVIPKDGHSTVLMFED